MTTERLSAILNEYFSELANRPMELSLFRRPRFENGTRLSLLLAVFASAGCSSSPSPRDAHLNSDTLLALDASLPREDGAFGDGATICSFACLQAPFQLVDRSKEPVLSLDQQRELVQTLTSYLRALPIAAEILTRGAPACSTKDLLTYLGALSRAGELAACVDLAQRCIENAATEATERPLLAYLGATCADAQGKTAVAESLFRIATKATSSDDATYAGRILAFARFLAVTQGEAAAKEVLSNYGGWGAPVDRVYHAVQALAGRLTFDESSRAEEEAFIDAQLTGSDALLRNQLFFMQAVYWANHAQWHRALSLIVANLTVVDVTTSWVGAAYNSLYRQGPDHFALARAVYQAYLPHAHPSAWLPSQFNTYTYTELYEDICQNVLLQGGNLDRYRAIINAWRSGAASIAATLADAQRLLDDLGPHADGLSLFGSMHELSGDDAAAGSAFWQAH